MMLDFVRNGGGADDKTSDPIEVEVVDIHHDIATAVVRSAQYREYLHLVRSPDGWRIVNAFWQYTDPEAVGPR
jgi:Putative lumazine-binding